MGARRNIQRTTVLLLTSEVLVAGGAEEAELYDPDAASFARVPGQFGDSPLFAAATRLLDGRVLITGRTACARSRGPTRGCTRPDPAARDLP